MNKQEIKVRLDRITAAAEQIVSIGACNTMHNGQQLVGIQRMAGEIWALINAPEQEDETCG